MMRVEVTPILLCSFPFNRFRSNLALMSVLQLSFLLFFWVNKQKQAETSKAWPRYYVSRYQGNIIANGVNTCVFSSHAAYFIYPIIYANKLTS
ncbi:hypothetical protein F4811DRAFT_184730 [Daldinia bambusicola]|nr:hypothetical protein F4811DRAFT_184730 [Daldinia bambusicola]